MYYFMPAAVISIVLWPFIKSIKGLENIPKKESAILALSHQSYIDPLTIMPLVYLKKGRFIRFIGMKELFTNKFNRFIMGTYGKCISVNGSVQPALEVLKRGHVLGIYPGGGRSYDGKVQKPKTGVAVLALESKAPVIPVALNTFEFWSRFKKFPRFNRTIEINIGKPINLEKYYNKKHTKKNLNEVANLIMTKIQKLLDDGMAKTK